MLIDSMHETFNSIPLSESTLFISDTKNAKPTDNIFLISYNLCISVGSINAANLNLKDERNTKD
jgi:hypothetical protein